MRASLLSLLILLGPGPAWAQDDPADPLEPLNRAVHAFNEAVDEAVLLPLAKGYRAITPGFVQAGVRNFFSNLDDVRVLANDLLQARLQDGATDLMRVAVNSTLGLFGVFDVAAEMGLRKNRNDFGLTLGRWGVPGGPYLVLPFFGPSSLRDGIGLFVDYEYLDPARHLDPVGPRNRLYALRVVSGRSDLIEAKAAVDMAALDGYEFARDFYLERRRVQLGQPPRQEEP
ncbi:MAG: VacJ family lipoprotein [Thiobacillaceae bacterium]|nr:VacJ family lipoprotein [Thiobacillaceae bacterium]